MELYKSFPPRDGYLKLPISSRQGTLAGIALHAACRPAALWLQRAAWLYVKLLGPNALPGSSSAWQPPMNIEIWDDLTTRWRDELGPYEALAICERRQASRKGISVLLVRNNIAIAFVKLRETTDQRLRQENAALHALHSYSPTLFSHPMPLSHATVENWDYLATTALPSRIHRVADKPPLDGILNEIQESLASFPRRPDVPAHWVPIHGDFTPWNLRVSGEHELLLYDWEASGWGPPRTDEVLYHATSSVLRGTPAGLLDAEEAINFLEQRLSSKTESEARMTVGLRRAFKQMRGDPNISH